MSTQDMSTHTTGGRHPVNVNHLVFGLVLSGLLVVWGLATAEIMPTDDLRWLLPVPWLVAGGAGLVAAVVSARRRADRQRAEQAWDRPGADLG